MDEKYIRLLQEIVKRIKKADSYVTTARANGLLNRLVEDIEQIIDKYKDG
jgi:hypothetical protein